MESYTVEPTQVEVVNKLSKIMPSEVFEAYNMLPAHRQKAVLALPEDKLMSWIAAQANALSVTKSYLQLKMVLDSKKIKDEELVIKGSATLMEFLKLLSKHDATMNAILEPDPGPDARETTTPAPESVNPLYDRAARDGGVSIRPTHKTTRRGEA